MKSSVLFALTFILFSFSAQAQTGAEQSQLSPQEKQKIYKEVKQLIFAKLKERVITLTRDVRVYHYFDWNPKSGNYVAELKDPRFQDYFKSELGQFWTANPRSKGTAGPGLYAAIDPSISVGYGNTMLEISLSKESKILDLNDDLNLDENFLNKLNSLYNIKYGFNNLFTGEHFLKYQDLIKDYVSNNQLEMVERLKESNLSGVYKIAKEFIKTQGIVAVAYPYSSKLRITNLCTNYSRNIFTDRPAGSSTKNYKKFLVAFLIFGKPGSLKDGTSESIKIPKELSANLITSNIGNNPSIEKQMVYERVQKIKDLINKKYNFTSEDYKTLRPTIFGCDEAYTEDMNL